MRAAGCSLSGALCVQPGAGSVDTLCAEANVSCAVFKILKNIFLHKGRLIYPYEIVTENEP